MIALFLSLVLQGTPGVPATVERAPEYADWIGIAPGLVRPFKVEGDELRIEGVAFGALEGPTVLVTSFDRQVAEPWVRALAERIRDDAATRDLFERVRLVVLPALAQDGGDPARFGVDFPVGWMPGALRPGAAEIPLASKGTRGLAQWMLATESLVAVFALDGPDRESPSGSLDLPPALSRLAQLRAAISPPNGGWLDFARGALGLWTLTPRNTTGAPEGVIELIGFLGDLPKIALSLVDARQLAIGLWQLDVALDNLGELPTHPFASPDPRVPVMLALVTGVKPVALARGTGEVGSFDVGRVRPGTWPEPSLGAGERRILRLVVELDGEAADASLSFSSPRLGRVDLDVELRPVSPTGAVPSRND